ncbi:hypothetical protein [Allorhizocola rhizosphaerae]|nr:hypothetical protein [Allorhizocola rhizosphaerae]
MRPVVDALEHEFGDAELGHVASQVAQTVPCLGHHDVTGAR